MIAEEALRLIGKEGPDGNTDSGGNDGDGGEDNYQIYLKSLSDATTSFSNRCCQFQKLLLDLVRHMWASSTAQALHDDGFSQRQHQRQEEVFHAATLHKKIATLQTKCCTLEDQVKELVMARDEANVLERRVRKGLYRLASGRMKIGEVLKVSRGSIFLGLWSVVYRSCWNMHRCCIVCMCSALMVSFLHGFVSCEAIVYGI